MPPPARPRLVGYEVRPDGAEYLYIGSRHLLTSQWLRVHRDIALLLQFFDGEHTIQDICQSVSVRFGVTVSPEVIERLAAHLDDVFVLDSDRYRDRRLEVENAFRSTAIRPAQHAGTAYPAEPDLLRERIRHMFLDAKGPGLPGGRTGPDRVRGILSPHIDFERGGSAFAWGFKELAEGTDADLFVIVATSHYSSDRFILTRKDFATPLGVAKTDQSFVQSLVDTYGDELFHDEIAHKPEHSIELQVLFLQYLFDGKRPFTIVPLLVGSFLDCVESGRAPVDADDIQRMVASLRRAEAETSKRVCYVSSGDLAHIGMKFGDPWTVDADRAQWCQLADQQLLQRLELGQAGELYQAIAADGDERRICGFPPTYTMLGAVLPQSGRVLCYDQFVDARGFEIVSFASMAFYG